MVQSSTANDDRAHHLQDFSFTLVLKLMRRRMRRKTIEVDSDMIDRSQDELSKLIIRLENNPKISRKDRNTIKKIQEIRDTIQDSVLYAKLKKSVE